MIDGQGHVRITDFGLAAIAGAAGQSRAGTPAYMAPELLAGGEATVQSDIYALGLVLYELFTGRRAYQAQSIAELVRQQNESQLTPPTTVVRDLDPAIERAILRALEREPALRPRSALAVAASLPGGDPLAAALAAGETPSPEMVAAAGERTAIARPYAVAGTIGVVLLLIASAFISVERRTLSRAALEKPPEVLLDRAQQVLEAARVSRDACEPPLGVHARRRPDRLLDRASRGRWPDGTSSRRVRACCGFNCGRARGCSRR